MDVRQCKRCSKIFQYSGNPICQNCVSEIDQMFPAVRDYIYEHPRANMDDICEATGARSVDIRRWLREGRLVSEPSSVALLECEGCGGPVLTGRYCSNCTQTMRSKLASAATNMRPPEKKSESESRKPASIKDAKMHIGKRKN